MILWIQRLILSPKNITYVYFSLSKSKTLHDLEKSKKTTFCIMFMTFGETSFEVTSKEKGSKRLGMVGSIK